MSDNEKLKISENSNSYELINWFLVHHHFQSWGDPIQNTTYATTKNGIHAELVKIIDKAVAESKLPPEERPALDYKTPMHDQEWKWSK